jgi:dipeptidyl aminopeptidase/acylaminoacyl peptidase
VRTATALLQVAAPVSIAGGSGAGESLLAPAWSPDGALHVLSDRSGWWNLYRVDDVGLHNLAEVAVELGAPHWQFGATLYGFLADGRIAVIATEEAVSRPSILDPVVGTVEPLTVPHTSVRALTTRGNTVTYLGGSPAHPDALIHLDVAAEPAASSGWEQLYVSRELPIDPAWLSEPEAISFPTSDGMIAHAWLHRPRNPEVVGPDDERPPLIVTTHGGPTSHVPPRVELGIAYWTSRGFAVVDVNYRGSTGFGRTYRNALRGTWGVYDVDDCVAVVAALTDRDEVDPARAVIRGGSAGGFTTLAALTFRDTFAGGASYYGVGDLGALAEETHKFESRYLDGLVGVYPGAEELYRERSPVHHADQLSCPIILLQGLLDKVVPPAQAEQMIAAMAERDIPYAYITFDDEDHGFRRAENVVRALEAELSFYGQLFELALADDIPPVEVVGLDR